jgi:hypothetical protein
MDNYKETIKYIEESIIDTIITLTETSISNSAFLNACNNIDAYKNKQLEKCTFFKNSTNCLAKIKAMTKETLELIVVNSEHIKDEEPLSKTVRVLEKYFKSDELRK